MVNALSSVEVTETGRPAPFWTKLGAPGPDREAGRVGVLDIYNTLFVPPQPRVNDEEIAALRARGLTAEGALLLRKAFFAGNIGDLKEVAVQAVEEGKVTGILILPRNDTGPDPLCACPYLAGMFGKDPKDIDLLALPELKAMPDAFIALLNARAKEMYDKEFPLLRDQVCDRANIRQFHLRALEIALAERAKQPKGLEAFDAYCAEHSRDGDRLLDYAVAKALEDHFLGTWEKWPDEVVRSKPIDLIERLPWLKERVRYLLFAQMVLDEQWDDCAQAIEEAGGYLVQDRAYSVLPHNAEVWRDWREQHVEHKGPGVFHINADKTLPCVSGCNVPGDPWGAQKWDHVVAKYQENPDGVIDYIVETIAAGGKRVSMWRIDHALAWIWQYFKANPQRQRVKKKIQENGRETEIEEEVVVGEYFPALKEKIFRRLREKFPDTEWMLEDCGYTDDELKGFMQSVGCGGMATVQWAPHPVDPAQARSSNFETYGVLPHGGTAFFRNADTRADHEWFSWLTEDNKRFYLEQLYPGQLAEKWQRHVVEGEPIPTTDWMRYCCSCAARLAILNLQSATAVLPGKRDERRPNIPSKEHPALWQLRSRLERKDLSPVLQEIRRVLEETQRALRPIESNGPLRILALSQNPGMVQSVEQGGVYRLKIACNRPPKPGERVALTSNTPWSAAKNERHWGSEDTHIESCSRCADGTCIWEVAFTVPENAPEGTYEIAGTIHAQEGNRYLCFEHRNLVLRVETGMAMTAEAAA